MNLTQRQLHMFVTTAALCNISRASEVLCISQPALTRAMLAHRRTPHRHPRFAHDLRVLVEHPDWQEMLRHNPIRAEHEYRWCLESRFPGARLETLAKRVL